MDIIRRKHLKNGRLRKGERREYIEREYKVYRRAEAAERDIQFVDWRAVEPGQWGLTDDGWVGECTDKRQYKEKDNIVLHLLRMVVVSTNLVEIQRVIR